MDKSKVISCDTAMPSHTTNAQCPRCQAERCLLDIERLRAQGRQLQHLLGLARGCLSAIAEVPSVDFICAKHAPKVKKSVVSR